MADDAKPKSKKGAMALLALAMLAAGGGGVYGALQFGLLGGAASAAEPDMPRLVRKGANDPYAPPAEEKDAAPAVDGEGGSEYRTAYHSFEEGFTSNLKDSPALIQLSLAASTRHDGRVIMWLGRHELALRFAVLTELAETPEEDIHSARGRERLQERLTGALNRVLEAREGFGGVDNVYFEAILVQ